MPHDRKGLNYSVQHAPRVCVQGEGVGVKVKGAGLRAGSMRRVSVCVCVHFSRHVSAAGMFGHTHETRSNSTALLHNLPRKK